MPSETARLAAPHRFRDLDAVVDEVHALFATWEREGALSPPLDAFSAEVMKLAVHEWIANIVQHADFEGRAPEISFAVFPNGRRVRCVIEDNSRGFDFEHQLAYQESEVAAAVPPDRGRGLLMLIACTEDLRYDAPPPGTAHRGTAHRGAGQRQRLEFWISADNDPCLDIPF